MLQQRLAADLMQNLGQLRFQARTLARGQNDNGNAGWDGGCYRRGTLTGLDSVLLHAIPMIPKWYPTQTGTAGSARNFGYSRPVYSKP